MWLIDEHGIQVVDEAVRDLRNEPDCRFRRVGVLARILYTLWKVDYNGAPTSMEAVIYKSVFEPFLDPKMRRWRWPSRQFVFWFGVLAVLYRRKIFLKV